MKFSPDGKSILIMTNGPIMRMVDAYNGFLIIIFLKNLFLKGNLTHTLNRENSQVFFKKLNKLFFKL